MRNMLSFFVKVTLLSTVFILCVRTSLPACLSLSVCMSASPYLTPFISCLFAYVFECACMSVSVCMSLCVCVKLCLLPIEQFNKVTWIERRLCGSGWCFTSSQLLQIPQNDDRITERQPAFFMFACNHHWSPFPQYSELPSDFHSYLPHIYYVHAQSPVIDS